MSTSTPCDVDNFRDTIWSDAQFGGGWGDIVPKSHD